MKIKYCLLTIVCIYVLGNQLLAQDYALDIGGSGGNRYVYCQNLYVSGSAPRTVEAWVYPRSFPTNAGVFECGHGASGSGLINFGLRIGNANEWKVELHDQTLIYNSTGTLNTWNHFALVYDGTNIKLYHNGNIVINAARNINTIQSSFLIGRLAEGFFDGKIDEVRFWNVARTQAQIQSAMYTELSGNENGLLAEYRMNEGTGTAARNSSTRSDLNSNYNNYLNAQIISNAVWTGGRTTTEVIPLIPTNITRYSATLRAEVKNITANTTEIGICYATSPLPLTSGSKITGSLSTGIFFGNITGLTSGTTYYYRPYVIQNSQVYYSTQLSFIAVPTAPPGSGNSWEDPIRISDLGHIAWVSENSSTWGKIFSQEADIDASVTSSWPNGGWQPIGYYPYFTGKYYGNGHTISGIYINRPQNDDQGFFGVVTGEVHSLALTDVNIRGNLRVGALAGKRENSYEDRSYSNCYSTGVVKGWSDAGGLIGYASGPAFFHISSCFSTCTVEALATYGSAGGLISTVYGNRNSSITNCYSRGNVSGVHVGGFVQVAENITVSNCYSTGSVTATQDKGGFVNDDWGTFNNCYWDTQTSGTTTSEGGTGLPTVQMKSYSSFKNIWDFYGETAMGTGDYWRIDETGNYNDGYPFLNWQGSPHQVKPIVTTQAVTNTSPISATGNGNITELGYPASVNQYGVCWSTSANPTTAESKTQQGAKSATGAFTSSITGLTPGTLYHVRSYATNDVGTSYGEDVQFTALKTPTVTTQAVTAITSTTATGNGNVINLGVPNPTQYGVCWSTIANPTTDLETKTTQGAKTTTGAFTSSITGLTAGTTYHIRAYATNSVGTAYGEDVQFTTSYIIPTVTTQAVTAITTTTATGNGSVTNLGVPNPTQYGICWSTSANPTIALSTKTELGAKSATGAFTSSITELTPGTTYHVRAYATNSAGTAYGMDVEFNALNSPTVTTQAVTNISSTTVTGNGNISNLGSPASVTQHGVCWGTTANPTTDLETKTTQGAKTTTGAFTSNITGLTSNTTYYVRAYATNNTGTAYGENVLFTTTGVPSALCFNGTNQYITGSVAVTATDNITMEAWVKWDGQTGSRCIIYNGNSGGSGYGIFLYTGASPSQSITILCGGRGFVTSGTLLPTNTWHHIAAVRASGVWKLYLDGIEKTLNNITVAPNIPSGNMFIGSGSASAEHFKGSIDEVRFWIVARTLEEIRASMNTSLTGTESGLEAYYRLNEGTGTNINDNSGNSKNAAIIGSAVRGTDVLIPDGNGSSAETAYQIVSLPHLYWIGQNSSQWNKYYKQMNDIDASTTSYWSNGGWTPIGNNSTKFTGKYDGQGFKIDGLNINRSSDFQGFFGRTNGATISNLVINNAIITGRDYSGILSGHNENNTSISNCSANGTVSGTNYTGGLIGYNDHSTVQKCHNSGNVSSSGFVGGLLGFETVSSLSNSYSTANVTCTSYYGVSSGGLNGWSGDGSNITNCYSIGIISGIAEYKDGLIGRNHDAVTNCFWNRTNNPSLGTSTPAANYGTGKTTEDMKKIETYTAAGWDFYGVNGGTIWNIGNGRNNGYPYLQWQYPDDSPLPVELSSFTAAVKSNKVTIKWRTDTEVNNYGFEVQRSVVEGRSSEVGDQKSEVGSEDAVWEKVAFVEGAGNSNSPKEYSFTDDNIKENGTYSYRLKQIDNDGKFEYSDEIKIDVNIIPAEFALMQNYPNPFNPTTNFELRIADFGFVSLRIIDVLGKEVALLVNENKAPGIYKFQWDAGAVSSGVYFYIMQANQNGGEIIFRDIKKMIVIK